MQDTELYPEASKIGFIGRATFQLNNEHQLFAELVQSQAKSRYVLSPNPIRIRNLDVSRLLYPVRGAAVGPSASPPSAGSATGWKKRATAAMKWSAPPSAWCWARAYTVA
ncbi:hypothetical protein LP419_25075 [Massilia sp. H-1]|nr:hypothetical protein LP419_25075 [Massilia sp. H-1]